VSSSHIRGLVSAGEVAHASVFLGRPFQVRGEVVHGDGRGSELGFPTANLIPDERLVRPDQGVYAALADGRPAAVNIGVRPQFETGRGVLIEAYLIDFDGDLYGRELRIDFLQRLRGEKLFPSVETLTEQIAKDVQQAREICARHAA
jgi:riboflavin kinase/FMN adenylyltransferase